MRMRAIVTVLGCMIGACGLTVTGIATDEGTSSIDAGADAGQPAPNDAASVPTVDAAGKSFCASLTTPALFCDDFDTAPDASFGWDRKTGSPQRTTSQSSSPPASLDALVATPSPALLEKDFKGVTTSISVELDVRYVTLPTGNPISPVVIAASSDQAGYLYLYVQSDRSYMQVSNDEYSGWEQPPPTAGAWHHVSASVTFSGTATKFAGALDGKAYDWSTVPKTAHPWQTPTTVTVRVGANPYQVTGEVFVDNVVVNAR
jgi:hypothetical protein